MNVQLKKGLIEVCVLATLLQGPSYGYAIISDISNIISISESTLYPILRRLETGGLLKTFTKDYSGRLRRYYEVTPMGRKRVEEFKEEWDEMKNVYGYIQMREGKSNE